MSALAAARTNLSNKGTIIGTAIGYKAAASQTFYDGGLVSTNSAGYLIPTTTVAGTRVRGVADLANAGTLSSSATLGATVVSVKTGIFPFACGTSTDAVTIADIGAPMYALDDQTVSRLPGAGRPIVGELIKVEGTLFYVGIGFAVQNDAGSIGGGTAYQGRGSLDAVAAPGALSVNTEITTLAVDGTDAYTLANGLFLGQRKVVTVISGANTPVGTITPATPAGYATVTGLGVAGEGCEFIWGGAGAWYLVGLTAGVTIT